ncbi:aldehyde dehydrogenase [Paenibacillus sp. YN15]|uniref:aldehyde dehydrogenase n=1 Tax=Paenibacillus sp. YN15 TaxID=1742774 RepID=UPI000DCE3694|nr:aldehyde dehydrogenase [Paenibacillus sp. YN15]RAU99574.1 aldehyde dehydrogenase [Paenibacillus sp. YN15]
MKVSTKEQAVSIVEAQRSLWRSGQTLELSFRLEQLRRLKSALLRFEKPLLEALRKDLGKGEFEGYTTEVGFCLHSIGETMKKLGKWMKPKKAAVPLHLQPSRSWVQPEPYGSVLIIGPFNYPLQLLIEPLIGAIAAGNCAVLKPSEAAPAVAAAVARLIGETFPEEYIQVVEGEKETVEALIHAPFDYMFFTGSAAVGRIVMKAAAENLVPVTLELGGKSPVVVEPDANLEVAAKRIIWGKLMNTGQTCIAPDYVLAHSAIKDELVRRMKEAIVRFYGEDPSVSPDYGRIINTRHFDRLAAMVEQDRSRIVHGGAMSREERYIGPTLLDQAQWEDASMAEEIFGPILPILTYDRLEDAIRQIQDRPKPLALYLFTESKKTESLVLSRVSFGGGCVNDTISHVVSSALPFGGVGQSGIGAYHGRHSFELFSHRKSVLKKTTRLETGLVFPPYKDKLKLVRRFLR